MGFESIFLGRDEAPKQVEKKFGSVDIIYLPGGDIFLLLNKIRERGIDKLLRKFDSYYR